MQGRKTHEQQMRILERRADVPDARQMEAMRHRSPDYHAHVARDGARQSEFPVSRGGLHQEHRGQNKHNHRTQDGHKPQRPTSAQEKR